MLSVMYKIDNCSFIQFICVEKILNLKKGGGEGKPLRHGTSLKKEI